MSPSAAIPFHPCRHRFRAPLLAGTALASLSAGLPALAGEPPQLPSGGMVTAGQALIAKSGGAMTITQTSPKAILEWQSFNVGPQGSVTFLQPDASSMILNRVTSADTSLIRGRLSANGQVVLVNPNGVVFGKGASVDVGGLVASALDIGDGDFLAGTMAFQRNGRLGQVVNHGSIRAAQGGYAALLGGRLASDGLMEARLGTVVLASGETAVLTFAQGALVGVQLRPSMVESLIRVGGIIQVGGGRVLVTASAASAVLGGVINIDGVIEASSLTGGGLIAIGDADTAAVTVGAGARLDASAATRGNGGTVRVDSQATAVHGVVLAEGGRQGGDGGHIETSGARLDVIGARVDAAAPLGQRGSWLLDPVDFVIDSSNSAAIAAGLASADVTIQTTASGNRLGGIDVGNGGNGGANGDIVVAAPLSWSSNRSLILDAYHSVLIDAPVSASGDTAGLVIKTGSAGFYTGDGGSVGLSGAGAALTINGQSYRMISSPAQFQAMGPSGFYALVADIDLSLLPAAFLPIGFSPVGNNANPAVFTGTLEGLGHRIAGLAINDSVDSNLGLISNNAGLIRDLTIIGGSLSAGAGVANIGLLAGEITPLAAAAMINVGATGTVTAGDGSRNIGGLVGRNAGNVLYGYFNGSVAGGSAAQCVGGLVGENDSYISNSYAKGVVSVADGAQYVGGLTGYNPGAVNSSFAGNAVQAGSGAQDLGGLAGGSSGNLTYVYATGAVAGGDGAGNVGGLAGFNSGVIQHSYASGAVTAGGGALDLGGLAGVNSGTVQFAYSLGAVGGGSGAVAVGGLLGANNAADVGQLYDLASQTWRNTGFWDVDTSGQAIGIGNNTAAQTSRTTVAGLSDGQARQISSYDFPDNQWFAGAGGYPQLIRSPFVLSVSPASVSATYGAASGVLSARISNFWPGDAVNLVGGLVLSAGSGAGTHPITASGASATSLNGTPYQFAYGTGSLTLAKAPLVVTADDQMMTYGGTMPGLTAHYSGFVNGDTAASLGQGATVTSTVAATADPGSYGGALVASGGQSANYTFTYQPGTLTIEPAPLLATADDRGMTYGGGMPGLTVHYSGFVNGDTPSSLTTAASVRSTVPATAGVGVYPGALVASGAQSKRYVLTYLPGTLTISRAPLVVTADDRGMTYGGVMPELTARYSGFVNGDTASSLTTAASVSSSVKATAGAGVYPGALVASGAQSGNYSITYLPGTLTINRAVLLVSVDDQGMTYGGVMPGLTARYSGFVNGDTVFSLTTAASISSSVPATAGAGVYPGALAASGARSGNYSITYLPGTLTINRAALSWSVPDLRIPYGAVPVPPAARLTGVVGADRVAGIVGLVAGRTPFSGYSETVTGLSGPDAGNYLLVATGNQPGTLTLVFDLDVPWPVLLGLARDQPSAPALRASVDRLQLAEAADEQILECQDVDRTGWPICRIRIGHPAAPPLAGGAGAGRD